MRFRKAALVLTFVTIWGLAFIYDRDHRFEIVAAGAGSGGSGGSQQDTGQTGDTEVKAFLVDHRTGKVWIVNSNSIAVAANFVRIPCNLPTGCKESALKDEDSGR